MLNVNVHLFFMHCIASHFFTKFCSGCFGQVDFHLGTKRVIAGCVRQLVVLCSNDCMGIGLGGLISISLLF